MRRSYPNPCERERGRWDRRGKKLEGKGKEAEREKRRTNLILQ
jgi:hypothetical protein